MTPIFKKGDKQLIKNYRPISLPPHMWQHFRKTYFQSSLLLSTYKQSNYQKSIWFSSWRFDNKPVIISYWWTSSSFLTALNHLKLEQYFSTFLKLLTRCGHEGLVFKLAQNGISGSLLKLFQNYLNNRKQRIVLNGSFSEYSKIASGGTPGLYSWAFTIPYIHQWSWKIY